jgi:hypothetical protein
VSGWRDALEEGILAVDITADFLVFDLRLYPEVISRYANDFDLCAGR